MQHGTCQGKRRACSGKGNMYLEITKGQLGLSKVNLPEFYSNLLIISVFGCSKASSPALGKMGVLCAPGQGINQRSWNTTNSLSLPATNFTKPNREERDGGLVKAHMDIARTAHHEFSTPSGPVLASEKQFSHKPSHEAITHQHTALMLLQNSRKGSIPIWF